MKIFEAISDTNIGGAGILLITRLKHTDLSAFQTTVILPQKSLLKARLEEISIPTIEIRGGADRSLDVMAIASYVSVFRKHRPDLVNCHGCFSARVAAKLCHIPGIIYTRHCAYPLKRWQSSFLGRQLLGTIQHTFCDKIIAVADAAKDNLVDMGISPDKIQVIINGVDALPKTSDKEKQALRQQLDLPDDAVVIGICARLEPCKGHIDLLRAARILLSYSDRYRFLIVGEGSLQSSLMEYSRKNGLTPYVRFVGFQKNVAPYVNLFDIQVNCSIGTETSSLALSEGMSLGIPSVVSDYGGNPHMIHDGVNGLVYPTHHYEVLARKIHAIGSDRALYQVLSSGARQRFLSEFQASLMTKQTERLYRKTAVKNKF